MPYSRTTFPNSKTIKPTSLTKPAKKSAQKPEVLVVGYSGKVQLVYNERNILTLDECIAIENNGKTPETKKTHSLLFPCISTVERVPRLCGTEEHVLSTNLDFDLYPCSGCQIETDIGRNHEIGNTIFLTNSFGITPLHVVPPHSKDNVVFNLPLESLNSPKDGLGFSLAPFTTKDDLTLVRLPQYIGLRSVMVPELPPDSVSQTSSINPNCIIFSYAPPCVDNDQIEQMKVIKSNGTGFEKEECDEVVDALSYDVNYLVNNFMAHHKNMIASYGYTKPDWVWEDLPGIQGHSCSTLYGYSGSAVRMVKDSDCVTIKSANWKRSQGANMQHTNNPAIPTFHGIHLQTSQDVRSRHGGITLNQFIKTDSLSFIYLYSIAISKSNLELDYTIFPTIEHAKASLNYLQNTKQLDKMQDLSCKTVSIVNETVDAALKAVKTSIELFENYKYSNVSETIQPLIKFENYVYFIVFLFGFLFLESSKVNSETIFLPKTSETSSNV